MVFVEEKKTWKLKRTIGDFFAKYLFLAFTEVKQNEEFLMLPAETFKCFEPRSLTYLFVPKILKIKINLNKAKAEVEKLLDLSLRPYIIFTDMLQSTGHKESDTTEQKQYLLKNQHHLIFLTMFPREISEYHRQE